MNTKLPCADNNILKTTLVSLIEEPSSLSHLGVYIRYVRVKKIILKILRYIQKKTDIAYRHLLNYSIFHYRHVSIKFKDEFY